jgi:hypothetical protein
VYLYVLIQNFMRFSESRRCETGSLGCYVIVVVSDEIFRVFLVSVIFDLGIRGLSGGNMIFV